MKHQNIQSENNSPFLKAIFLGLQVAVLFLFIFWTGS